MRYLVTFLWVFLLLQMVVYVVSSMNGVDFNFMSGLVLSIPVTILISIIPALLPEEDLVEQHH